MFSGLALHALAGAAAAQGSPADRPRSVFGYIDREYGVGRGRIDLVVRWPYPDQDGKRDQQWEAIELKVRHPGEGDPLGKGLEQLDRYLDRLGLKAGTLVIFDRRPKAPPVHERTSIGETLSPSGKQITLVRA